MQPFVYLLLSQAEGCKNKITEVCSTPPIRMKETADFDFVELY